MKTTITVVGGRPDMGEVNIKYIEDFPDMEAALEACRAHSGYPILTIEVQQGDMVWELDYHSSAFRKG